MKYQAPIGATDPNDPYIDGNSSNGTAGSPVPAAAIEHPQREIEAAIVAAGLVPDANKLDQLVDAISLIAGSELLVGTPIPWPSEVIPAGYLEMKGQAFDPVAFPKLALAYPTNTLIDMRGEFIRGWDNGRGVDISRVIGSSQLDEFKNHTHDLSQGPLTNGDSGNQNQYASWWKNGGLSTADGTHDAGGPETRPRNIAFMYITRAA